ncbi:unnamed protein product [Spirodela intermedia]|uniref:Leucine-rich repeat-containing N-terminal plant-type domain-containing protein n=1 Tax=Spirodela intermedia TaxID=51605 RepID=A0A7I8IAI0_SPIIN|nr:unnamed protein product [Spirodela intermedia]CAA6654726.1 unnamed protein product [Spirodela intermedia]
MRTPCSGWSVIMFPFSFHCRCCHPFPEIHPLRPPQRHFSPLHSWKEGTDCCRAWAGVTCEGEPGKVVALDLSGSSISGGVHPALFSLTSLRSLNLSCNRLNFDSVLSRSFEQLTNLTHLNLSDSGFSGQIPVGISRLRTLVSLDLSAPGLCSSSSLTLQDPDLPTLIRNLSNLRQLYLDGVNISAGGRDWGRALSTSVPNLHELSLSRCSLSGPIDDSFSHLKSLAILRLHENNLSTEVPEFLGDFSSLRLLRLSTCGLRGSLPRRIFQLPHLETLDLSMNPTLSGSLPDFPPGIVLEELKLSATNFSGTLPESIGNLRLLKTLHLTTCRFSGSLPASFHNLTRLVSVDLSINNFQIHPLRPRNGISPPLHSWKEGTDCCRAWAGVTCEGEPAKVVALDLSGSSISGGVHPALFSLTSLRSLNLSCNRLNFDSVLSRSFEQLTNLTHLNLSDSGFSGQIPVGISRLRTLVSLDLSAPGLCSNELQGSLPMSISRLQHLKILRLASNNLSGTVELSLFGNLRNLSILDLSYNRLIVQSNPAAAFPSISTLNVAFCGLEVFPPDPRPPPSNVMVDFSNNQFASSIPSDIGSTLNFSIFFSVSNNRLTGGIPESVCSGVYLQVLDLSHNSLEGPIPGCLVAGEINLRVLNLRSNKLNGTLPRTFEAGCKLRSLNLHGNILQGAVPQSLSSCESLEVLDLGNNRIEDAFPFWLGNLSNLRVLGLRSNKFYGPVWTPRDGKYTFSMLQIIDISSNRFNGSLPSECFQGWKAMTTASELAGKKTVVAFKFLDLTRLYYVDTVTVTSKGLELTLVKILTIFTSIDLSNNDFHGSIPPASLDLSKNRLSGEIPPGLVHLSFLSTLYLRYNRLVGRIPQGGQFLTFPRASFEGNEGLCGPQLLRPCTDATVAGYDIGGRASNSTVDYSWVFIFVGLGYGGGLALVFGPFVLWGEGRRWYNQHVDRKLLAILPSALLLLFDFCKDAKVDSAESLEEDPFVEWDEGRQRRFCVFCTRLEFRGEKVAIHHDRCWCTLKEI